ncbi:unnamed protein product [Urochloa decumbens]|uniref:F-box domain-containing protein n=1 Tax=Urochloa decumbens TaxID=240449 RepID=A0ABC9ARL3_9POAL
MPPARRPRGAHRSAPYGRGWLPPSCFRSDYDGNGSDDGGEVFPVPDDAISAVLARLVSAADVVRSAATCRRWACLVAKDAAVLSGALPPLPCLTLGFLHQENAGATARRRRRLSSETAPQPCFVPTAAAARLIGQQGPSHTTIADAVLGLDLDDDDRRGLFEHARPMAARNSWLVLELRQERYTDGVKLCVCNPTRGELFMLPPLAGTDSPGDYACALYTGHDFEPPRPLSAFFRLLIVYNRRAFTALRSYSSGTSRWSMEAKRSWGPKIPSEKLHELGQSIVVGGVAYWHMRCTAFAVRVDTPEPTEVCMPPSGPCIRDLPLGWHSLGVDLDGKLIFIDAALGEDYDSTLGKRHRSKVPSHHLTVATRAVLCPSSRDDGCSGEWEERGRCIRLKQLKVRYEGIGEEKVPPFGDKMNLRWFCEKSGNLLFTLGQGTGSPGAYVLNMATERVEKVADGIDCDSWRNFVGYEMDGAAYLASIYRR